MVFYIPFLFTANINPDELETSGKNWRNKAGPDKLSSAKDLNGNSDSVLGSSSSIGDDSFTFSTYTLIALTLIVILLILNWCRKGRNNIRTRRKYFLLNKLGI